jgi:hypothetical protein
MDAQIAAGQGVLRNPATVLESEPLCKAAWAFQERVLSARTVHFAGDQSGLF